MKNTADDHKRMSAQNVESQEAVKDVRQSGLGCWIDAQPSRGVRRAFRGTALSNCLVTSGLEILNLASKALLAATQNGLHRRKHRRQDKASGTLNRPQNAPGCAAGTPGVGSSESRDEQGRPVAMRTAVEL